MVGIFLYEWRVDHIGRVHIVVDVLAVDAIAVDSLVGEAVEHYTEQRTAADPSPADPPTCEGIVEAPKKPI